MKNNIDDAFIRRFNSILKFPFPDPAQRALIWKKALPKDAIFKKSIIDDNSAGVQEEEADIPEAVKKYELAGGSIINVVQYAGIKAVEALHEKPKLEMAHSIGSRETPEQRIKPSRNKEKLVIYLSDILEGIRREMIKEGKPFST